MEKIIIDYDKHTVTCTCGKTELIIESSFPYCPNCRAFHFACGTCGFVHELSKEDQIKIMTFVNDVFSPYLDTISV